MFFYLNRIKSTVALCLALVLSGCASHWGGTNLEQSHPLSKLVEPLPKDMPVSTAPLLFLKGKKLAIVLSENSLNHMSGLESARAELKNGIRLIQEKATMDAALDHPSFLAALIHPLKSKFIQVVFAQDISEGFSKGADYVVTLDIKLQRSEELSSMEYELDTLWIFLDKIHGLVGRIDANMKRSYSDHTNFFGEDRYRVQSLVNDMLDTRWASAQAVAQKLDDKIKIVSSN